MSDKVMQLLVHSARQIVQVTSSGENFLTGGQMKNLKVITAKPDDGLSVVADKTGTIVAIGYDSEIRTKFRNTAFERTVDASDLCILPGFVDAHSHPVWAGDRVHEFRMKLAGATYMSIHNAGGGIHYTVEHTRRASEDELYRLLRDRLLRILRSGTTVVECKSGYGLNVETELKMLRVLERAKRELSSFIDISITFCGAHAIPKDMTEDTATRAVIEEQLPAIARSIRLGEISVDNIDVFCEKGVFELENSKKILEAGREMGFRMNFHADELYPLGSAEVDSIVTGLLSQNGMRLCSCPISHISTSSLNASPPESGRTKYGRDILEERVLNANSRNAGIRSLKNVSLGWKYVGQKCSGLTVTAQVVKDKMGASIKAEAMSHLEQISEKAIQEMAKNHCVGIILPTTVYILRLEPPPVRKMIEAGVPIALGSDFNPNAFCLSMPMVMHLACMLCRMSLEEALVASTLNAACSLGLSSKYGSIEVGKKADLVLLDAPTWEHIVYQFGEHDHLIQMVVKNGFVAYEKTPSL